MVIGLDGKAVPGETLGNPVGEPVQVMEYVAGEFVAVYGKEVLLIPPTHLSGIEPGVIVGNPELTDIIEVLKQVVGSLYDMIVVPVDTPVTPIGLPEVAETIPILVETELHVPPDVALLKLVDAPIQVIVVPVILAGDGFTVNEVVAVELHKPP